MRRAESRYCERMAEGVEPNANPTGFGLAWLLYWACAGRTRWRSVHSANHKRRRGPGTLGLSVTTTRPVRVCGWSRGANPAPWPRFGSYSNIGPEHPRRPVLRCPGCMSCRNAPITFAVYLTRPAPREWIEFCGASDKRFSLGIGIHERVAPHLDFHFNRAH